MFWSIVGALLFVFLGIPLLFLSILWLLAGSVSAFERLAALIAKCCLLITNIGRFLSDRDFRRNALRRMRRKKIEKAKEDFQKKEEAIQLWAKHWEEVEAAKQRKMKEAQQRQSTLAEKKKRLVAMRKARKRKCEK